MPAVACPRCQHVNPADAAYCYFDGTALAGGQAGRPAGAALPQEFVFPSGRRCRTFDDLAKGCQEEWAAARDLLRQGIFRQFFTTAGRADLATAAQEAMAQADPDIGLTRLVGSLPVSDAVQGPKLDLNPRRVALGNVLAGEQRQVQLVVGNQGLGMLQGSLSVTEGNEWLKLGGANNGQCSVQTQKQQQVILQIDTRGLPAGQPYGGKLTVVTNGGVSEVPVRLDLAAHPFQRPPFQGARTPREMAEKMRSKPKDAVGLLESGELARWFQNNGWNYPVRGAAAKGVAGVQQFFELMGLAKPPPLQVSHQEVRLSCDRGGAARGQVALQTPTKKWVYASVGSDAPWLRVLTPSVAGPQQAAIGFEIDGRLLPPGRQAEGTLKVVANGNQALAVRVRVETQGAAAAASAGGFLKPIVAMALALLLLRLVLVPVADFVGRALASSASAKEAQAPGAPKDVPARSFAGWLDINWFGLYFGIGTPLPDDFLGKEPPPPAEAPAIFRQAFISNFARVVIVCAVPFGLFLGPIFLFRRGGGVLDLPWGAVAGLVLGVMVGATLACLVLVIDLVPHLLWGFTLRGSGSAALLPVWVILVLVWWTVFGAALGVVLQLLGPWGRLVLNPVQQTLAGLCRLCGLSGPARFFTPAAA